MDYPTPEVPAWAVEAGLPPPQKNESFPEYIERIGFDLGELTEELTEQTICLVNVRLHSKLIQSLPDAFTEWVSERANDVRARYSYRGGTQVDPERGASP